MGLPIRRVTWFSTASYLSHLVKKRTSLTLIATAFLVTTPTQAATTLIQHNFGGLGADPLNGAPVDTVNIIGAASTWVSDGIIAANGQVTDGTNTDRGASIDLGASFAFTADTTYTLSLGWQNLGNAILFGGFMVDAPSVGSQMQVQSTNFGIRARKIAGTDPLASWRRQSDTISAVDGSTVTPTTGSTTLTLNTYSLTNATFTVDGVSQSINLSADYRYLWIAYEDPSNASPASDAKFTSLNFSVIPEPSSAALLGSLGMLALLRRRR